MRLAEFERSAAELEAAICLPSLCMPSPSDSVVPTVIHCRYPAVSHRASSALTSCKFEHGVRNTGSHDRFACASSRRCFVSTGDAIANRQIAGSRIFNRRSISPAPALTRLMFPLPTTAAAAAWVRPIAVRAHAGVLLLFRYVRGKGDANAPPIHNHSRTRLARRGRRWLSAARAALGLGTLTLVCWLFWPASTSGAEPILPPLYGAYHQQELWLPQHNVHLPAPEGKHGKYIWFANHATCPYDSACGCACTH
jgi:hypothetical protein